MLAVAQRWVSGRDCLLGGDIPATFCLQGFLLLDLLLHEFDNLGLNRTAAKCSKGLESVSEFPWNTPNLQHNGFHATKVSLHYKYCKGQSGGSSPRSVESGRMLGANGTL